MNDASILPSLLLFARFTVCAPGAADCAGLLLDFAGEAGTIAAAADLLEDETKNVESGALVDLVAEDEVEDFGFPLAFAFGFDLLVAEAGLLFDCGASLPFKAGRGFRCCCSFSCSIATRNCSLFVSFCSDAAK